MEMTKKLIAVLCAVLFTGMISHTANAQEMVFQFRNPAFGGNPINYQWMLSSANAQNKFQGQGGFGSFQRDPLADFQQSLQRQVLSQLTREIITERFGNVDFTEQGTFEFGEFSINVNPVSDGIDIKILNILTGDETSIRIPNI